MNRPTKLAALFVFASIDASLLLASACGGDDDDPWRTDGGTCVSGRGRDCGGQPLPEASFDAGCDARAPTSGRWTEWTASADADAPRVQPHPRAYAGLAWGRRPSDGRSGALLAGGGNVDVGLLRDSWWLDEASLVWSRLPNLPAGRAGLGLTFAGDAREVAPSDAFVLFGGTADALLGDTLKLDPSSWSRSCGDDAGTCACGPCPRADHAMVYDSARGEIVLFGGRDDVTPKQDTWVYASGSWTLRCPASCDAGAECCTSPPPRSAHAMAYDPVRGVVVLHGGRGPGDVLLQDTWEWNGSRWVEQKSPDAPGARAGHAMTSAMGLGVVLFGGIDPSGIADKAPWVWDGARWESVETVGVGPKPRAHAAMTTDPREGRMLLFGGGATGEYDDLWFLSLQRDAVCGAGSDAGPKDQ